MLILSLAWISKVWKKIKQNKDSYIIQANRYAMVKLTGNTRPLSIYGIFPTEADAS